jgi:CHASE3 domain sensor protein
MIRKAALQVGFPALLAFIAWNAYLSVAHSRQMQKIAALTLESSLIQSDISDVLRDLADMETGQRGYLLTEDPSYLQPYSEAKERIGAHLAALRSGLAVPGIRTRIAGSIKASGDGAVDLFAPTRVPPPCIHAGEIQ